MSNKIFHIVIFTWITYSLRLPVISLLSFSELFNYKLLLLVSNVPVIIRYFIVYVISTVRHAAVQSTSIIPHAST